MKYNIDISYSVNNDLNKIHEYLSELGGNSSKKFRESFEKFIEQVSNMPFMFPQYARKPKYHKTTLAYNYLVFYKVDKKNKTIKIQRVLHGKQNVDNVL